MATQHDRVRAALQARSPRGRRCRPRRDGIVGLLALAGLAPLDATVVPRLEEGDLARRADLVVLGRCVSSIGRWHPEREGLIVTDYAISVASTLKGPELGELICRQLGGVGEGRGLHVPGSPRFEVGEEGVLFLRDAGDGTYQCLGWGQGRYRISRSSETGGSAAAATVRSSLDGLGLYVPEKRVVVHPSEGPPEPLDAFLARIRGHFRSGNPGHR